MDQQTLIERVVAEVVRKLATPNAAPRVESAARLVERVITADLLADSVRGKAVVEVSERALVTPSAGDWLRDNKVELVRHKPATVGTQQESVRRAIVQTGGHNVERVLGAGNWQQEPVGTADEAARLAISETCRGDAKCVVVFSSQPEIVACFANRNDKVRAAVVMNVAAVDRVKSQLKANVFVVDPVERGFFELRNLLKRIEA